MRRINNNDISDTEKYIKDRLNTYDIPDSLLPDNIADRISGIKHEDIRTERIKIRPAYIIAIAAACFAAAIITTAALNFNNTGSDNNSLKVADNNTADNSGNASSDVEVTDTPAVMHTDAPAIEHTTYSEVYRTICDAYSDVLYDMKTASIAEKTKEADTSAPSENNSSDTGSVNYTDTDVQVKGVMEGDLVKTDGEYIYVDSQSSACVTIYKKTTEDTDAVKIASIEYKSKGYKPGDMWDMYIADNILVLTGTEYSNSNSVQKNVTSTLIYDISNPSDPVRLSRLTQSGNKTQSRMSDGYLYVFSVYDIYNNYDYGCVKEINGYSDDTEIPFDEKDTEQYIPCTNNKIIPEDKLYIPTGKNRLSSYIVMTSIDMNKPDSYADTLASLGWSNTYYVSNSNIYSVQRSDNYNKSESVINKYSYSKGQLKYIARKKVDGMINNSYCMHEYKGNLVYVYTTYKVKKSGITNYSNGLAILDEQLKKQSSIDELGIDETIYASYYIDDMAYFVTYRNTDPVFAVDISDTKNPKLKSELKLPGFSDYLHSFGKDEDGNTLLIGIGRGNKEAQTDSEDVVEDRVKISVFTVYPDGKVELSHTHWEKKLTYCDTYDRHAIFIDEENGLIGYCLEQSLEDDDNYEIEGEQLYVLYRYNNGRFERILNKKLDKLANDYYYGYGAIRGLRIDKTFYPVITFKNNKLLKGYTI